jgi:hypothetical protein
MSTVTSLLLTPFEVTCIGPEFAFCGTTARSHVAVAAMGGTEPSELLNTTRLLDAGVAKPLPVISSVSPGESEVSFNDAIFGTTASTSVEESSEPHDDKRQAQAASIETALVAWRKIAKKRVGSLRTLLPP